MALEDVIGLATWNLTSVPRDVDLRYSLILAPAKRDEVVRLLALRLQFQAEAVLMPQPSANAESEPAALASLDDPLTVSALRMVRDAGATLAVEPNSLDATCVREDLEDHAVGILQDRETLLGFYRSTENVRSLASEARRRIFQALEADEPAWMERLREALELLREHVNESEGARDSFAWLDLAWCMQRLGHEPRDTEPALHQASVTSWRDHSLVTHLAHRMLANAQLTMADKSAASASLLKALDVRSDPDTQLDAARAAMRAGRPESAGQRLVTVLRARPSMLAEILAEPEFFEIRPAVIAAATCAQGLAQEAFEEAMQTWASVLRRVKTTEEASGMKLDLPGPLISGQSEVQQLLEQDHFFGASRAEAEARSRAAQAQAFAMRSLGQVLADREGKVAELQQEMDAALRQRKLALEQAKERQYASEAEAKHSMAALLPSPERIQQGCGAALGCGCAGFAMYLIATFALGTRVALGPETTVGKVLLSVLLIPVLLTALLQVVTGLRRASLEAGLQVKLDLARRQYEEFAARADTVFRRQVAPLRGRLEEAQADAAKLRDALPVLEGKTPED